MDKTCRVNNDTSAPTLKNVSPTDNSKSVAIGSNLVFNFSESVQAGSGNIVIYNSNGTVAQTIAVTDSSQVTISGSSVTLNPSSDLAAGSSYYINMASGVIKDLTGNSYAGILSTTTYNFSTATSAGADDYSWATDTTGVVTVNGGSSSGVINSVYDKDLFTVSLTAGTTYVFSLTKATNGLTDPYLTLFSPDIVQVAYDDDSGGSQNSKITYTATKTGTFYLVYMITPKNRRLYNFCRYC